MPLHFPRNEKGRGRYYTAITDSYIATVDLQRHQVPIVCEGAGHGRDASQSPEVRHGPLPKPDTATAFLTCPAFDKSATDAPNPMGYSPTFVNEKGAVDGDGYLGMQVMTGYDPTECAEYCNGTKGCTGINIFFERSPAFRPDDSCPNPPSHTSIKCTLWGNGAAPKKITYFGLTMGPKDKSGLAFHLVIAGSNGYVLTSPPETCDGFEVPMRLDRAIDAPVINGIDTHIASHYFSEPYNPCVCTEYCRDQTSRSLMSAESHIRPCNFMTSFIIRYTDSDIGMYCSFFTRAWGDEYATIDRIDDGRPEKIQIVHVLAFTMKEQLPDPLDPRPGPDRKDVIESIEPVDEETEDSETGESGPEESEPEPEESEPEDSEVSASASETEASETEDSETEDSETGLGRIYDDFPYEDRGTTDTYVHNRDGLADKKPSLASRTFRALLRGS